METSASYEARSAPSSYPTAQLELPDLIPVNFVRAVDGRFLESGATRLGGEVPVNLSGGLIARGHPIGATGLMMLNELAIQLRGEAGDMQIEGAAIGLQENGGGIIGREVASASVILLERER